jgi:hypothetical protein
MIEDNIEIKPLTAEQVAALDTYGESLKETSAERAARKDQEDRRDRRWNKQWALDKSVEWCKHINELVSTPGNGVDGKIMKSADVESIADIFYEWLYKDTK